MPLVDWDIVCIVSLAVAVVRFGFIVKAHTAYIRELQADVVRLLQRNNMP
jgi:hypothetical protein